ncbi:MAG: hypothetical protein HXX13_08180 [Bacteroidetes bacterium]|nr:hypothetical protein [Bacteroidota bacterium]
MSYRKIFWGVLLVLIGILFILKNTGILFFSWHTFWNLWPVILILWGVSLIPVKDWIKAVISLATIVIAFVVVQQFGKNDSWNWHFNYNDRNNDKMEEPISQNLSEDMDSIVRYATLDLNIGVGDFSIKDTTDKLIDLDRTGSEGKYSMTSHDNDSMRVIKLSLDKAEFKGEVRNTVKMKLNTVPVWDLELNVGAAEVNFDLSKFKTRKINLQGGASDIEVKLGDLYPESNVNIEAGAASITVRIPKDAGAEITNNTFLASKSFNGFQKTSNHHYQTDNYVNAKNKIHINMEAGMASINVERY